MRFIEDIGIENRCFGMFHVRLATVFIGLWQIMVNLIIISILIYIILFDGQHISNEKKAKVDDIINLISLGQRKDFIFNLKEKYTYFEHPHKPNEVRNESFVHSTVLPMSNKVQDYYVAFSISVFTISFCTMMIFGSVKVRPSHMMPYFSIEVFYFLINSLTLISEFSGMPLRSEYDKKNGQTSYYRWSNYHMTKRLNIVVFLVGLLLLSLNLYVLNVVWACYKFLLRVKKGLELDSGLSFSTAGVTTRLMWHNSPMVVRIRRLIWLTLFRSRHGTATSSDVERTSLLEEALSEQSTATTTVHQTLEEIEKEDLSLPKYEDLLLMPANANMPPPYFEPSSATTNNIRPALN